MVTTAQADAYGQFDSQAYNNQQSAQYQSYVDRMEQQTYQNQQLNNQRQQIDAINAQTEQMYRQNYQNNGFHNYGYGR